MNSENVVVLVVIALGIIFFGMIGATIGHKTGYESAINEAGKAACLSVDKEWVFMDGQNQCVTVTP